MVNFYKNDNFMRSVLFFLILFLVSNFLFGQRFISEPIEVSFSYPSIKDGQSGFKTYSAEVIDKEGTLKDRGMNPNDLARNFLILPEYQKVVDSADRRLYVFVGEFELLSAAPFVQKELVTIRAGEERPIDNHYMKLNYRLPIYAHLYDCSGKLIWADKYDAPQEDLFGDKLTNQRDLDLAWKKHKVLYQQLMIEDFLVEQSGFWIKDIQNLGSPKKEKESLLLLSMAGKRADAAFMKGVRMSKTIIKGLGTKPNHQTMLTWSQPVLNYWEKLLPTLKKQSSKHYTGGLYNLALLYYALDQLEEAGAYNRQAFETKEFKFLTKDLVRSIQQAEKYFAESGYFHRQSYNQCSDYRVIDPDEIVYLEEKMALAELEAQAQDMPTETVTAPTSQPTITREKKGGLFKKEVVVADGMIFFNNGQLKQGRIDGDINRAKVLRRGIAFEPFDETGKVDNLKTSAYYKPSQLKRFVTGGKTYESHTAGTLFFKLIGKKYFMEVLEDGKVKLLQLKYRKRNIWFLWLVPWVKEKTLIKVADRNRAVPIRRINMKKLLKDAPPILEKFKTGAYGNKRGKSHLKRSFFGAVILDLVDKYPAIARDVIREYNAYIYKQKEKANTGGFKVN